MSSRGLVRSMIIIGGSQSVTIVIGILRVKLFAMMLGPAGLGLLGLYNALLETSSILAGLGLGSSGVRQIAASGGDAAELSRVRRVLLGAHVIQGLIGMGVVWLFREPLALSILGDAGRATEVGLIGVGLFLTLVASSQTALLQGMRRIGDLARVAVIGGIVATVVGLAAVWLLGIDGLIWFLLVLPLSNVAAAFLYTRRLPRADAASLGLAEAWAQWRPMASLGIVFMASGLVTMGTLLAVRILIARDLGLEAVGHFQASWTVTMQYVGFLLGAMAADYYPRLTGIIRDRTASSALVNDQAQIGLALGGPILLAMIGLAPWVIELLYTAEFTEAVAILQWQTLGNVLKLASWPIGFILVASARSGLFLVTESLWSALFLSLVWIGLPLFGLEVTGFVFAGAYLAYFVIVYAVVRRIHEFRWQGMSLVLIGMHLALGAGVLALVQFDQLAGAVAGTVAAALTGLFGVRFVLNKIGTNGWLSVRIMIIINHIIFVLRKI
jgi:O-antigen/teichoic acid export membrane protein